MFKNFFHLRAIFDAYDFNECKKLVDVGGGVGKFLIPLLDVFPNVKAVLFDLPAVINSAKELIGEKYKGRLEFKSGSFFERVPEGGDCYMLRFIIHDWNDEKSVEIARNVAEAMKRTNGPSKMIIVTNLIHENEQIGMKLHFDMLMAVGINGKERTEGEFATILDKSGLKINRIVPSASALSVVEVVLK